MLSKVLELASFCFNNGELINAYMLCKASPVSIRQEVLKSDIFKRIEKRLDDISSFQTNGRENMGFSDPPNVEEKALFKRLLKEMEGKPIRRMVDIGCFSGWVGRHLALRGVQVLGIDIGEENTRMAKLMATGTMASFETLEATKLGDKYPKFFDGAIAFDVLEHVFDPHIFKSSVEKSVKDGGWIFINLPRWRDEEVRTEEYPDIFKEHIRTYTDGEVKKLFPGAKIELMEHESGEISNFITYQVGGKQA